MNITPSSSTSTFLNSSSKIFRLAWNLFLWISITGNLNAGSNSPFENLAKATTPQIFYPGEVSTSIDKFNTSFSPDLKSIYFTATSQKLGITGIAEQSWNGESFGSEAFAPFAEGDLPTADVHISPDGKELYFSTFKDWEGKIDGFHFDIWVSHMEPDGRWDSPTPFDSVINSGGNEFYPIKTNSGNFYFNADTSGNSDIYVAHWNGTSYDQLKALPNTINTELREADAFIAPDESFMIFVRVDAPGAFGNSDLYISFHDGNGNWTEAVNMGESVNSSGIDGSPYVTPDNKVLIFTTDRKSELDKQSLIEDYGIFSKTLKSHKNGSLNFYYLHLNLEEYRPK